MNFKATQPIEDYIRVTAVALSEGCHEMCPHCALNLLPNGPKMKFSDLKTITESDLKFDEGRVILSYGAPFSYYDKMESGEKNLSHAVSLLIEEKGVSNVFIWTSALHPGSSLEQAAVDGLSKHSGKIDVGLSFDLFREEAGQYIARIVQTAKMLQKAGIPVSFVNIVYSIENEKETKAALKGLDSALKPYGGLNGIPSDVIQVIRLGRAEGITKHEIRCVDPKCSLKLKPFVGGGLVLYPKGELGVCFSAFGHYTPRVANALVDSQQEVVKKYRAYVALLDSHMAKKPRDVERCRWHMAMGSRATA